MSVEYDRCVLVDVDELEDLREAAKFLRLLLAAGVDNWEGYEMVQDMMAGSSLK